MKTTKVILACIVALILGALSLGPAKAQVMLFEAQVLIPEWNPGEKYEPAGVLVGRVESTYDVDDPSAYVEVWEWTTKERPDLYAVQGGDVPKGAMATKQTGFVEDSFGDGCATTPDPPDGVTYAVYNAQNGEVPTRQGTLIVAGNVEHWYLADSFLYAGQHSAVLLVRRDEKATVEPDHSRYIRVTLR